MQEILTPNKTIMVGIPDNFSGDSLLYGFGVQNEVHLFWPKRQQKNQGQGFQGVAWNSFVHFHACLDEFPLLSAPVAFNYTLIHNSN